MLTVITAPSIEPVTLADAKSHCRIDADITEHDGILELLIQTAREQAEHDTGRALITQVLQILEPAACRLQLRKPPFLSMTSVVAVGSDGAETAIAGADYSVDRSRLVPELVIKSLPSDACFIKATYSSGYGAAAADIPAAIRRWMLMHISTHFEHRESVVVGTSATPMPTPFIDGLLDPYRIHSGF